MFHILKKSINLMYRTGNFVFRRIITTVSRRACHFLLEIVCPNHVKIKDNVSGRYTLDWILLSKTAE